MRVAEIQISYSSKIPIAKRIKVTDSQISYEIFLPKFERDMELREMSYMMLLNRNNRLKGIVYLGTGGTTGTVMDPIIILGTALKSLSTSIIIAHNHPSGNLDPSSVDIITTKKLNEGAKIINIALLDHLILSEFGYTSMADDKLF